jgi:hypothetical protein
MRFPYAGMIDLAFTSRGFWKCRKCQRLLFIPPSRARSGPMRREPKQVADRPPGLEYCRSAPLEAQGRIICE